MITAAMARRRLRTHRSAASRGETASGSVIADVAAMRDHAAAAHPGLPVILFGHSMGGLIALNAAVTHPDKFDAVAVWNSNFNRRPRRAAPRRSSC